MSLVHSVTSLGSIAGYKILENDFFKVGLQFSLKVLGEVKMANHKMLDEKGIKLLRALQENARASYSDLAKAVGLSVPSVTERIRKFEDAGIITGYHAHVNLGKLGLPIKAVVRFQGTGTQMNEVDKIVRNIPEVVEAHRMTGDTCFMAIVSVASMTHLEQFLDRLSRYGQTQTSIIVSTPVRKRFVDEIVLVDENR
jgi:Lrp/AsnC family transcriptional regulator, leucine-responsive regulatory protein